MPISRSELLRSLFASTARGWRGTHILRRGPRPAEPLVLYDREAEPDCRLLRELLTELDLDLLIKPCPIGGRRFARELGRGQSVPVLIDPNTGARSDGLDASVSYLLTQYGNPALRPLLATLPARLSSRLASLLRRGAGERARPSRKPAQPLELYSFESSPYSRLVRERLCELELPYLLRSLGKQQVSDYGPPDLRPTLRAYQPRAGSRRQALLDQTGKVQVPYLIDPNRDQALFESAEILAYLEQHYAR